MKILHIDYSPSGKAVPDNEVEKFILNALYGDLDKIYLSVSTENVLQCARYLKITNRIDCDLHFSYMDVELPLGEQYEPIGWNGIYPSYNENWVIEIIKARLDKLNNE